MRLKNWLEEGRKQLDDARQALHYLCEPVPEPREMEQFLRYFCGDANDPEPLNTTEPLRVSFYKAVALFTRAYADLAQNLVEAGYSEAEEAALKQEVEFRRRPLGHQAALRRRARHQALRGGHAPPSSTPTSRPTTPEALGELGEMSLTELIIQTGIHDAIARKLNEKGAVQECDRRGDHQQRPQDHHPGSADRSHVLRADVAALDDLIKQSRADTAAYEAFLLKAEALVKKLAAKQPEDGIPATLHGMREATVFYNNLGSLPATQFRYPTAEEDRAALALKIDYAIREHAQPVGMAIRLGRRRC